MDKGYSKYKNLLIRQLVLGISLFLSLNLFAQNHRISFDNFSTEDGLSNSYINQIVQDKDGWIWIGTGIGINKFDGINFKKYNLPQKDSTSVEDIIVRNFYESKKGDLYVCSENLGLAKYNRDKDVFERVKIAGEPILEYISVKDMTEDDSGNFWIATKQGLWRINEDNQSIENFTADINDSNSLIDDYVRRVAFDQNKKLWVGTQKGLERFDPIKKSFTHYSAINSCLSDDILDIYIDKNNSIWMGTANNGAVVFNQEINEIKPFVLDEDNDRSNKVNDILQEENGNMWFGSRGGLFFYDKEENKISLYTNDLFDNKSLIHNSVICITQDFNGDIWVGTRAGVSYLVKKKQVFENYKAVPNNNNFLNNSEIYCIWIDEKDNVWTGTENGGINILNRKTGKFSYITTDNGLSSNCIKSINSTGDGNVLIGTFKGGLNIYNTKTHRITVLKHDEHNPKSISDDLVWDISIDGKKNIWLGTASGLDQFDPATKTFQHFPQFDDMVNGVSRIGIDKENDLWITSETIKIFRPNHGIINSFEEYCNGFCFDSKGTAWIMSRNRGIVQYDKYKGVIKAYDEDSGIASNLTLCMLEDNNHNLWVSTTNGLSFFNTETKKFKNYYKIDGLQGNQFYYGAAYKSKNDELIFGGKNGFNIFNPNKIVINTYQPPVYLTDFKIFNNSVKIGSGEKAILKKAITEVDEIEIPYNNNVISFEFAALNYANSQNNKYKYKLDGFDDDWNLTKNRNTTYTNLDPGKYTFRVIASNDDGIWNNEGTSKELIILPPFYLKRWFLVVSLSLTMAFILLILFYTVRRWEEKKNFEFEKREAHRLHELDNFKLQFFTNISHEIKTPLTLIISPLEKILHYEMSKAEIRENLQLIHNNAKNLFKLINQLLDYRKIEEGKLSLEYKKGDIVRFCREIFSSFENLMIESQLKYNFKSVQDKIISNFDPDKLKKIIDNLVSNAIKYNKPNGSVSMFLSLVIDDQFSENSNNEFIQIVVKDTGKGIPSKNMRNLFTRFYSADNNKNSTSSGIGLAFTKELVKLHNGSISVDSKEDEGSTFTVLLPLINDESNTSLLTNDDTINNLPEEELTNAPEEAIGNREILLIVEDNREMRLFIKSHFKNEFRIYEAENGSAGLDLAFKVIPDIIISDIMMPEMDGNEFCEKIKNDERTSHIPVIHLTALSSKDHQMESLTSGADDFITKPFDISILQTKVDNLLLMRKSLRERFSKELVIKPTSVKVTSPDERFLQKAIKTVENHIEDPELDIENFVSYIGISRMQLYRKLAALTNMTVKEFINDIRLKRAYQLLTENQLNVSEVAYAVGFSDISYFGKCFRKKYGQSASQVIKTQRKITTNGENKG